MSEDERREVVVHGMRFVLREFELTNRRYVADLYADRLIDIESSNDARKQFFQTYFHPITFASRNLIEIAWPLSLSAAEAMQMLTEFASKYQQYLRLPKSILEIRNAYDNSLANDDRMQFLCVCDMLQAPTQNIVEDVKFLIGKTICPVKGDEADLLCLAIDQPSFPGQLEVVQMLISAGAPTNKAEDIANRRFDNLWYMITNVWRP